MHFVNVSILLLVLLFFFNKLRFCLDEYCSRCWFGCPVVMTTTFLPRGSHDRHHNLCWSQWTAVVNSSVAPGSSWSATTCLLAVGRLKSCAYVHAQQAKNCMSPKKLNRLRLCYCLQAVYKSLIVNRHCLNHSHNSIFGFEKAWQRRPKQTRGESPCVLSIWQVVECFTV